MCLPLATCLFCIEKRLHTLITGQEQTPVEVCCDGNIIYRNDMSTSHEEADNILAQQAIYLAKQEKEVTVLADDTDVYVLFLYHYMKQNIKFPMVMESPIKNKSVIDIRSTVDKHKQIIPGMLAAHALSGCDTVAACFGIGKGRMLNVLKNHEILINEIGNDEADWSEVMKQATKFIAACYGECNISTMSEARIQVWSTRVGRPGSINAPNLASLPPTTEAFIENVKRAHLQTHIWKNALQYHPKRLNPIDYGWIKEESTKSLLPTTVPSDVSLAPDSILKLIKCTCSSDMPCKAAGCGCNRAKLGCTIFCSCGGSLECCNDQTQNSIGNDEEELDS